jgi:hypothetical protein
LFIKRRGLFAIGFLCQIAALLALNNPPLIINNTTFTQPREIFIGEEAAVKVFQICGTSAEPMLYLRVENTYASDFPFDSEDGIAEVKLYINPDTTTGLGGSTPASCTGIPDGPNAYKFSFEPPAASANYSIRYKISPKAKYSLSGDSAKVVVNAKILSIQEGSDPNNLVPINDDNALDITVKANGLVYKPGSLKSLLPGNSSSVPPGISFAIMQFTLRAEKSDVAVKNIRLDSASNFATSDENRGINVSRIILLADDGDGDYFGADREIIVCDTGELSYSKNGNTHESINLPFTQPITLSAYSEDSSGVPNTPLSEKVFYVLYELGPAYDTNHKTVSCLLAGGGGSFVSNGSAAALRLNASLNITVACKPVDAWLISSTAQVNAPTVVVAGQRGVKMINFTYFVPDTHEPAQIKNVTIEIANGGGTFRPRFDDGVSRLLLYKYPPVNSGEISPSLAGVGEIVSSSIAVFRNQTLERGENRYYVVYDIGVLANVTTSAQAQVTGISVPSNSKNSNANAVFWSPKAPPGPAHVNMYPSRALIGPLRVTDLLGNDLSSIDPGQQFKVYVPIFNVSSLVYPGSIPYGHPLSGGKTMEVFCQPSNNMNSTRPVFYNGSDFNTTSTERSDISHEFTWELETYWGSIVSVNNIPVNPVVLTFNVTASNLKTSGPVYVDAQVLYNVYTDDNAYMYNDSAAPKATYQAHYDKDSYFRSAAAALGGGQIPVPSIPGYVTLQANGLVAATLWILPGGVKFTNPDVSVNSFVNGDKVPLNSSLTISLNAEMGAHLNYDFEIYQNGVPLKKDTNWFLSGSIISLPASNFSAANAGANVLRIAPVNKLNKNDAIPEVNIRYDLLSPGGIMEIKEILPYPSPYEPDAGSLYIGFENASMDTGTATIYIYDVTGREVFREEEIKVNPGYNTHAWAGDFSSGGKVGRGVYVLRMVFKGSGKRHEVITRFGVK